jgi:hypothetical protein
VDTGKYNIKARQGSTFSFLFTITSDSNITISNPTGLWNLTGYSAAMQVRSSTSSTTKILSLSTSSGIALGGTAGTVTCTASATTMAAIKAGSYVYDIELTEPSTGVVYALLEGKFTVTAEVTK